MINIIMISTKNLECIYNFVLNFSFLNLNLILAYTFALQLESD